MTTRLNIISNCNLSSPLNNHVPVFSPEMFIELLLSRKLDLHAEFHINGTLDFDNFTDIEKLPNSLLVNGDLLLSDCTNLKYLPNKLIVSGTLCLNRCCSLEALPNALIVEESLYLRECTRLATLPMGLKHIKGDLDLSGCIRILALPEGLCVDGDLHLNKCDSLETLPNDLTVGKNLYLRKCMQLTALPAGLKYIKRDLGLFGRIYIPPLSEGLNVKGNILLNDCHNLEVLTNKCAVEWVFLHNVESLYYTARKLMFFHQGITLCFYQEENELDDHPSFIKALPTNEISFELDSIFYDQCALITGLFCSRFSKGAQKV